MYIHTEKQAAFIGHPRTASSAMAVALLSLGFEQVGSQNDLNEDLCLEGWTIFAVVRDPYDLIVSWYYNQLHDETTFEDWLEVFLNDPYNYANANGPGIFFGLDYCTHILRYESLQADFDSLLSGLELAQTDLTYENVSTARGELTIQDHYTQTTADIVGAAFRDDIDDNNYTDLTF
jgi:hypothetical protein